MQQNVNIDGGDLGIIKKMLVFRHNFFLKNFVDCRKFLDIKSGVAIGAHQRHYHWFYCCVSSPVCIWGHTGINDIAASFNCFQVAHWRHT